MKRWLSFLLVLMLCVVGSACSGDNVPKSEKGLEDTGAGVIVVEDVCREAQAALDSGDYRKAYELLKTVADDEAAAELLQRLVFVPYQVTRYEKTVTYTHTFDKQRWVMSTENVTSTIAFDEKGNVLTRDHAYASGERHQYVYTYDDNGNLLAEDQTAPDGVRYTYTYTYDEKGNRLTEKHSISNGNARQTAYTYDANGNVLTEDVVHSSGNRWKNTYTYDENGNRVTEECDYSSGGKTTVRYTYDANGNRLTADLTNSNGYWRNTTFTYDANGNLLTEEQKDSYGDGHKNTYTYDVCGNRTSLTYTSWAAEAEPDTTITIYEWIPMYRPEGVNKEYVEKTFLDTL